MEKTITKGFKTQLKAAGLSKEAITKLEQDYATNNFMDISCIKVVRDPQCQDTFALKLSIKKVRRETTEYYSQELLWHDGDFDEVEFETWPPISKY